MYIYMCVCIYNSRKLVLILLIINSIIREPFESITNEAQTGIYNFYRNWQWLILRDSVRVTDAAGTGSILLTFSGTELNRDKKKMIGALLMFKVLSNRYDPLSSSYYYMMRI